MRCLFIVWYCYTLASLLGMMPCTALSQTLQGSLTVNNKFFHYEISPSSAGNYQVKIYTLDKNQHENANSTLTYSSQIRVFEQNNKLSEVRLFVAQRMGVQWQVLYTDGVRVFAKESYWEFALLGNALRKYAIPATTVMPFKGSASTNNALKTAVSYFVNNYSQHILENNQTATNAATQTGSVKTRKAQYDYELVGDWRQTGKAVLYIRQGDRGLVYQSLLQSSETATTHTIRILYAKPKNLAWEIYSSDYWQWTWNKSTQTVSSQKESLFMPPIQPLQNVPYSAAPSEAARAAVEQFISQCEELW